MAYARDLLENARDGSVEAALREHGAVLGRVCMALLGERAAAEKALERVARDAGAAAAAGGSAPAPTKAWLLGLARVACATQLSKLPVRTSHGRDDAPATERLGAASAARDARIALAALKPTEREAVVLHLVGGLDAADVAKACGTDEATARARLARGVSLLMAAEKNEGGPR